MDKAKEEAKRIAGEMRDGAEKLRQDVSARLPSAAELRNQSYDYGKVIHQLRTAHLVVLAIQTVVLYMESDRVSYGFMATVLPFVFLVANVYVVGVRWYKQVDGRHDFQQLTGNAAPAVKFQYGLGLFGGVVLAILVHFVSPTINTILASMLYGLFNYLSILVGGACSAVEVYEGVKKTH